MYLPILWKRPIKDRPWIETYKYSSLGGDITLYVIFIDTSCAITQTERMTDRQTDKQTNKQTDKQTKLYNISTWIDKNYHIYERKENNQVQ